MLGRLAGGLAQRGLAASRARGGVVVRKLCTAPPKPPTSPPEPEPGFLLAIQRQVYNEVTTANENPAKLFGFVGACCNWFLGLSAVYDASNKGAEVISLKMTCVMLAYSSLFGRWAGWAVMPRNYVLAGSHIFNVIAQTNQLRRCLEYKIANGGEEAKKEVQELATNAAIGGAVLVTCVAFSKNIQAIVAPIGPAYLSSPGGPFTIHPWPPMTKLAISGTSMLELDRPTDKISLSQYAALTLTGAIFSRYGLVVTPINYPLTSVNVLLFLSSAWHLGRKIKADFL
jgi:hypothetical protein